MFMYLKEGTHKFVQIRANSGSAWFANFDLSLGVVGAFGGSTSSIVAVGNGWYRCTVTGTPAGVVPTSAIVFVPSASSANFPAWNPAGTETVFLWGAQLEAGAFATSYIPTVASQVTRAADSASMIGNNFARWYNVSEGTLFADGINGGGLSDTTYNDFIFQANDGSFVNIIGLSWTGSSTRSTVRANNVSVGLAGGSSGPAASYKAAMVYKTNDTAISLNGAAVVTASSVTVPTGLNQARIGGRFNGTGFFCGHIKRIAYYPRRLANTELQGITS
jgi:hypothetical protein